MPTTSLFPISFEAFQTAVVGLDLEKFRARQAWDWFFKKLVFEFEAMTNLPATAKKRLTEAFPNIFPPGSETVGGEDGTIKLVLPLADGARVEAVGIPDEESRTFCLSSQVGCPVACAFCRTGSLGYTRNLTTEEIALQLLVLAKTMRTRPTTIVFMGMGEPFLNQAAVFGAIDLFTDPRHLALATRRITLSTAGVIDGIRALADRPGEVNLAVSLHSVDDKVRDHLIPLNRRHPLDRLRTAVARYIEQSGRRVSFEVTLLKGVNDGHAEALNLVRFCEGLLCHINLVRFNPFPGCSFRPAPEAAEKEFRKILKKAGIPVTARRSRGADILAACGQLAGTSPSPPR